MATYYTQYPIQPTYNYPMPMTEWSPAASAIQSQIPVYFPAVVPYVLTLPQVVTQICPYTRALAAEPVLPVVLPVSCDEPVVCYSSEDPLESPLTPLIEQTYPTDEVLMEHVSDQDNEDPNIDPLEFYLTLPKELFPAARMFSIDPNPVIDEFCKIVNIGNNTAWILDLEFGIPRAPVTRAIAVYDVQSNSIHCKNTPGAIHPGFESCSEEFKREILFYYDCIISAWYKGYMVMNYDKSVKNFQSWLQLPMQVYGMCWP